MPRYEIIIYWSQADEAFIAEVPELPGCAADGKTYKEALANVEIIIQEWIETAKNSAAPSPPPAAAWPSLNTPYTHPRVMRRRGWPILAGLQGWGLSPVRFPISNFYFLASRCLLRTLCRLLQSRQSIRYSLV